MLAYLNSFYLGSLLVLLSHYSLSMQTHVSAFASIASHLVYNAFGTMAIMVMAHPLI
jgi:hypothetical protein